MTARSIFVPAGKVMSMQRRLEYPAKGFEVFGCVFISRLKVHVPRPAI